jgi:hypothetical protein
VRGSVSVRGSLRECERAVEMVDAVEEMEKMREGDVDHMIGDECCCSSN